VVSVRRRVETLEEQWSAEQGREMHTLFLLDDDGEPLAPSEEAVRLEEARQQVGPNDLLFVVRYDSEAAEEIAK